MYSDLKGLPADAYDQVLVQKFQPAIHLDELLVVLTWLGLLIR